jgi:hypothetical protein
MKQLFTVTIILLFLSCRSTFDDKKGMYYKLTIEKGDDYDINKVFKNYTIDEYFILHFNEKTFHYMYNYDINSKTIYIESYNKYVPSAGSRDMRESKYSISVDTISKTTLKITIDNLKNPENGILDSNKLLKPPVILIAERIKER